MNDSKPLLKCPPMSVAPGDSDRPNSDVTVGSRWFIWNFHQTVTHERHEQGVRMVLLKPDGYRARKGINLPWVAAWRVQKFGFMHVSEPPVKRANKSATAGTKLTKKPAPKASLREKPKAQKEKVNLRGRPRKGETIGQARARRLAAADRAN